jgi:sarcosine oxidase, subunit gamma
VTVEGLPRTAPLHFWSERFADLPDGVQIVPEPFVAMADVRLVPEAVSGYEGNSTRIHSRPQLELPTTPSTWVPRGNGQAIWLGPDEWLVTDPVRSPQELEAELRIAVGSGGAVVDVSAQRTTLRLRGAHVRDVLATGCAIDLHPRAFPAGSAAQTVLGQAGVVLLALDDTATHYQLLVRSSFARYLAAWLVDAAIEYTDPGRGA